MIDDDNETQPDQEFEQALTDLLAGQGPASLHLAGLSLLTPERLERAERFFARRGSRIVLVARFIDGVRQFNGIIAGITAMPWRKFLLYNALGAFLWVGWWTTIAYVLGTHLVEIIDHAHRYKWWAIVTVVVAIGVYAWLHIRHIRRRRARGTAQSEVVDSRP